MQFKPSFIQTIAIIVTFTLFYSCKEDSWKPPMNDKFITINQPAIPTESTDLVTDQEDDAKWTDIEFSDVTVSLKEVDLQWYDTKDNGYLIDGDTAVLYLMPGDWIYSKIFKIQIEGYDEVDVYEMFENHMSITTQREMEVPMCVLKTWKSYRSVWSKLTVVEPNLLFESNDGQLHDEGRFPFSLEEFKEMVGVHCGPEWQQEIMSKRRLKDIDCQLFTTSFSYKVFARNSKTGKSIERILVFNSPTSC
ncbi:MAG: hypothetical protein ACI837_003332 [Crocinitomicaceae bacterium]|jgi:hypothetical protein